MQAIATTSNTRIYQINDEGDAFELVLIESGVQVGGGVFPFVSGVDDAFELAHSIGRSFVGQ